MLVNVVQFLSVTMFLPYFSLLLLKARVPFFELLLLPPLPLDGPPIAFDGAGVGADVGTGVGVDVGTGVGVVVGTGVKADVGTGVGVLVVGTGVGVDVGTGVGVVVGTGVGVDVGTGVGADVVVSSRISYVFIDFPDVQPVQDLKGYDSGRAKKLGTITCLWFYQHHFLELYSCTRYSQ